MIRHLARTGAALTIAALLLTACSGDQETPVAKHPVFDRKLGLQVYLALRQTQKAGGADFVQTMTFESKKGRAVQTVSGRMDFRKGTGEATTKWRLSKQLPRETKDTLLGATPGKGNADPSARVLVDLRRIHYRAGSAAYWLQYTTGNTGPDLGIDGIDHLRGSEGPVGGTLLEGLGATEATSRRTDGSRRTYEADMSTSAAGQLFPEDLMRELFTPFPTGSSGKSAPMPATVSVDGRGRVTHVRADLSTTLGKKGSAFEDMTSLTIDLRLSGHGVSKPATKPDGSVLPAREAVRSADSVKPGGCVDFSTGQRLLDTVVDVPCSGAHDGRVFAQRALGAGPYPGSTATREKAADACRAAYDTAPGAWISGSDRTGHYWHMWPNQKKWEQGGRRASCYVVTTRGTT
ncbi:septum formation family protein [Streptomyces sp. CHD11]|uniref:septum formation family protein n=1 Tax=Streptomyces sp. CHD11 TaxID=2741325 RepID=UPI001BFCAFF0|nr:septum formation family protein [Streptomyces sp. CHD11]MBT3150668.1 septum formation family protein [Streptomyces sp. CHD11]